MRFGDHEEQSCGLRVRYENKAGIRRLLKGHLVRRETGHNCHIITIHNDMQNMRSHKNVCTLVTFSCLPRKMRVPVNFKLKSRISLKRVIVTVNKMGGVMICNYLSVNNPEVL